jgi:hypothetical protein
LRECVFELFQGCGGVKSCGRVEVSCEQGVELLSVCLGLAHSCCMAAMLSRRQVVCMCDACKGPCLLIRALHTHNPCTMRAHTDLMENSLAACCCRVLGVIMACNICAGNCRHNPCAPSAAGCGQAPGLTVVALSPSGFFQGSCLARSTMLLYGHMLVTCLPGMWHMPVTGCTQGRRIDQKNWPCAVNRRFRVHVTVHCLSADAVCVVGGGGRGCCQCVAVLRACTQWLLSPPLATCVYDVVLQASA